MEHPDYVFNELARFEQLKAHAKDLGWELIHRDIPDYRPWGYVLRKIGSTNLRTNSAARLDPEDLDDPLSGLDSVSHMLDQIEEIQGAALPAVNPNPPSRR